MRILLLHLLTMMNKSLVLLNHISSVYKCGCAVGSTKIKYEQTLLASACNRLGLIVCNRRISRTHQDIQLADKPLTKILRIAIIGTPNSGKSTFINQIVGRRVFAISSKVHTTRARARAVINLDDTQVVFLDTPGLVTETESQKHNLENSFLRDGEIAMTEANIVAVVHDVGNHFTRGRLDPKVLRLLYLYPYKHVVLILNKVDMVKKKRYLLELSDRLTCKSLASPETIHTEGSRKLSEEEVLKEVKKQLGWPNFHQVFMVSALEGSGVGEVMEYFLQYSRTGQWMYPETVYTDQKPEKVICEAVKSRLLENLPNEIPYNCETQIELCNELRDGTIMAVVLITCPNIRTEKLIMKRIRTIAQEAESELRNTFMTQVLLKLVLQTADK
uniref:GTPase Era, mitochondrial n=1 Tax=Graphocephala atropunctata TaxID=36148 RepID=A0A1B6LPZ9_9HEMI